MYEMLDISRIGFALLLCCITFLARKYGRHLGQLVQRKFSNGLSAQRNPLDASNENMPIIGGTDRTVAVTERAYDDVHVLLLSWQGGDVRFYNQLVELAKVFRDYYNYEEGDSTIEEFLIPSENSKNVLDEKLAQFLKNEGPRSLLIIYYGGHGAVNVARRAVWKKFEKDGPEIPWHDLQTKLFERQSDILLLIDCCAAASATAVVGTKGLVEVEFAGGFEAPTPVWGQHSFTVNLIAELKKVHDSGTTVYDLHRNLWNTLQHYRPQQDGRERRAKPHHEWLAPWPISQFRSIHLQSLLSTAPIQLQNAARTQTTSLQRARSFDIVKLQAKIKEIHKWLEPVDQSRFHNAAVAAQEKETGGWVLQHHLFIEWKRGTNPFLVIYGTAGCGKTVLCASIANHMEAICRSRDLSNQRDLTAKFYFSFENFSHQHNLESLLKSIIQQLSFAPEIFSGLRDLYEENTKTWPPNSPSTSSLQELLISGLKSRCSNEKTTRNVFLIIDALDEIPKGSRRNEVIKFLKDLAASSIPFLHVLVTSRPKSDITSRLSGTKASWIALNVDKAAIRADIGIYVNNILETYFEPPLSDVTKEKIRERLTKDQDGMFRWVKLQMESLKRLEPASSEMVEDALAVLPPDLNASYLEILKGVHPVYQQQARNAFIWLCLASRPLFIEEIVEICATIPGERPGFQESRRFEQQEYVEQILKDLIVIDPPLDGSPPSPLRNVVRLGHFSVKEYLTGTDIKNSEAAMFRVTPSADKFIAESCLVYLFHNNSNEKREQAYCLRDYAWNQWAWHGVQTNLSARPQIAMLLFDSCVYDLDPSQGFANLRALGLIDWVDRNSAAENSILQSSLRNPYFHGDFQLHFARSNRHAFEYQPLDESSDIRLVRILPSEYDSPEIRCQMVHTSLDDRPHYDAISYTWSYEPERSSYIRLDGQVFPVRGKIATILRTLRSTNNSTTMTVWIDGLCINMPDLPERSSQVGLMARIYRQAREVAVVLEDDGVVPDAFTILEELYTLLNDDGMPNSNLDGIRRVVAKYDSGTTWNIILKLFSQTWWGRMWPIQEVVLASKATIIYGKTRLNFDKIQRVMVKEGKASQLLQEVYKDRESNPVVAFLQGPSTWNRARALGELRMVLQEDGRVELPHLLYASRFSGVSFPPDRIFSIYPLSLIGLESTAAPAGMVVDYKLPAEEVFTNCSAHLLRLYRNLDMFSYITPYYGNRYYDLPSWASTFMSSAATDITDDDDTPLGAVLITRNRFLSRPCPYLRPFVKGKFQPLEGEDIYSACGAATTATLSFHLPYLTLERGILVDRISHAENLHTENLYADSPFVDFHPRFISEKHTNLQRDESWRNHALRKAVKFYNSTFKTLSPEVFWRTIVADQWEVGVRNSPKLYDFLPCDMGQSCGRGIPPGHIAPCGLEFTDGRSMFKSVKNYLGLGPPDSREGDYIIVLPGGKVPYIFRADISYLPTRSKSLPQLRLIGECYVHGIMDGEIMQAAEDGEYEFQDIIVS